MAQKIVVTGMGIRTPLGEGINANWENLSQFSGGSGPTDHHNARLDQVPISNISRFRGLSRKSVFCPGQKTKRGDSFALGKRRTTVGYSAAEEFAEISSIEALEQAGLWASSALVGIDPERIGCTVSASKPLFVGDTPHAPERITEFIVKHFGLLGESRNVIAACATGAYSIALAGVLIEQGVCDVVLGGSVEPYPHELIAAGFKQMGVLSADGITRPFDHQRSGFSFGEGAGIVVLESLAHALARGARPLAQLSGWALGADGHSPVAFNSNGAKIAGVIEKTLKRAGLSAEAIGHINAHGTGTRSNDWIETQALMKAFGSHAPKLMISATKASTGHLLGASGSVEFILTVLALSRQFVPPTATLENPDPECALDYTPRYGRAASFEHALSLSFGFGGPIGVLAVSGC